MCNQQNLDKFFYKKSTETGSNFSIAFFRNFGHIYIDFLSFLYLFLLRRPSQPFNNQIICNAKQEFFLGTLHANCPQSHHKRPIRRPTGHFQLVRRPPRPATTCAWQSRNAAQQHAHTIDPHQSLQRTQWVTPTTFKCKPGEGNWTGAKAADTRALSSESTSSCDTNSSATKKVSFGLCGCCQCYHPQVAMHNLLQSKPAIRCFFVWSAARKRERPTNELKIAKNRSRGCERLLLHGTVPRLDHLLASTVVVVVRTERLPLLWLPTASVRRAHRSAPASAPRRCPCARCAECPRWRAPTQPTAPCATDRRRPAWAVARDTAVRRRGIARRASSAGRATRWLWRAHRTARAATCRRQRRPACWSSEEAVDRRLSRHRAPPIHHPPSRPVRCCWQRETKFSPNLPPEQIAICRRIDCPVLHTNQQRTEHSTDHLAHRQPIADSTTICSLIPPWWWIWAMPVPLVANRVWLAKKEQISLDLTTKMKQNQRFCVEQRTRIGWSAGCAAWQQRKFTRS